MDTSPASPVTPDAGRFDARAIVAGAGPAGLCAALALARAGVDVIVIGRREAAAPSRTVALFEGSLRTLETIGLRAPVEAAGAPLAIMRIVDDTGSLFRTPPVDFRASEIDLPAFGVNIENGALTTLLAQALEASGARFIEGLATDYSFQPDRVVVTMADGRRLSAQLVIGADGARSPARECAHIATRDWRYEQTALTVLMTHSAAHGDASTEFHTREGPCTTVPLPPLPGKANRSSLVWLMRPAEAQRRAALAPTALAREIETQTHALLGAIALDSAVALTAMRAMQARRFGVHRLALIGEAAHVFPPIGAQGLNLSLRDVSDLIASISAPAKAGGDIGADVVMRAYDGRRHADVASRVFGVDALNRALLSRLPFTDLARGVGLTALASIGPLRRLAMRAGVGPDFARARQGVADAVMK